MKGIELESALVNWSVQNSGHQQRRAHIGLSSIGDCPAVVYERYIQGQTLSVDEHLKMRLAYELEYALVARLRGMGGYQTAEPISLYGGLGEGPPEGLVPIG